MGGAKSAAGEDAAIAGPMRQFEAFAQRRKILSAYEKAMDTKREELIHAIEQQMKHAIDLFYKDIAVAFEPLAAFCAAERKRCEPLLEQAESVKALFGAISQRLGSSS